MRGQPLVVQDYKGGVNLAAFPYSLGLDQARDLRNVVAGPIGSVRKRNGFHPIATTPMPIISLGTYDRAIQRLIVFGDNGSSTNIWSMTSAGSLTTIKGAMAYTSGTRWETLQAPITLGEGPVWAINSVDPPIQWSGSGNMALWTKTGAVTDVPNGQFIVYHDNRVIIAGVTTNYNTRSTVYASAIGNPRNWDTPDAVTNIFDPDDGQNITGLGTVGPYIIVFKPRKSYVITDTDTLGYRNISDEIGCVSHRSITNTASGTFFLNSDRNVCVTDGTSIEVISDPIAPLLKQIPTSFLNSACAVFQDDKYYLSFSVETLNDTIVEFDTRNASWWIHEIQYSNTVTGGINDWVILDPQGDAIIYAAGADPSITRVFEAFKLGAYTDLVRYNSYWTTGWETFGQPHVRKVMRQLRADAKGIHKLFFTKSFSGNEESKPMFIWELVGASGVYGGGGDYGGDGIFGDINLINEYRYYTIGTARAWSFKFSSDDPSEWELFSHTFVIDPRTD